MKNKIPKEKQSRGCKQIKKKVGKIKKYKIIFSIAIGMNSLKNV